MKILSKICAYILIYMFFGLFNTSAETVTTSVVDFDIAFQNPSYLDERYDTPQPIIYNCDSEKPECKVNMNIVETDGSSLSSSMNCSMKIWNSLPVYSDEYILNTLPSVEFETCNPATYIFPEGTNYVQFYVEEENNEGSRTLKHILVHNDSGELLSDSWNTFIESKHVSIIDIVPESLISDEVFVQTLISGEAEIIETHLDSIDSSDQTSTNITDIHSEVVFEENNVYTFNLNWQRPSYIEESNVGENTFICDESKDECKINLKFTQTDGSTVPSAFSCVLTASFAIPESEQRCNPNTLIIPEGNHNIAVTITELHSGITHFSENYFFQNTQTQIAETSIEPSTHIIDTLNNTIENSTDTENSTQEIITDNNITPLEIYYQTQSPSYVEKIGDTDNFLCDNSKDECKVNLKFMSEPDKTMSSTVICNIFASFDIDESFQKCNPNTLTIPDGIHWLRIEIYHKDSPQVTTSKILTFDNTEIGSIDNDSSSQTVENNNQDTSSLTENIEEVDMLTETSFPHVEILVQGKIGVRKKLGYKKITCYTYKTCSINFTSSTLTTSQKEGLDFKWDFGNDQFSHKANPSSTKYSPGEYTATLYVISDTGETITKTFTVSVVKLYSKTSIKRMENTIDSILQYDNQIYDNIENIVIDQSKNSTELLSEIINKNNLLIRYGLIENNKKPKNNNSDIIKNITKNTQKDGSENIDEKSQKNITNNQEIDIINKKALAKNVTLRTSFQKKSVKIHGTSIPLSTVIITIENTEYKTTTDEQGKYQFNLTDFPLGEHKIMVQVFSSENTLLAEKESSEKVFTQEYLTSVQKYILDSQAKEKEKQEKALVKKQKQEAKALLAQQKKTQKTEKSSQIQKNAAQKNTQSKTKKAKQNITLRVSLQKKNLKLYGTTFPNSQVHFTIGKQQFSTLSDTEGNYSLKTNKIITGEYKIYARTLSKQGEIIAEKSSALKTFSQDYITQMRSYITQTSSKKATPKTKKSPSQQNSDTKQKNLFKKYSFELINSAYANGKPQEKNNIFNIKIFALNVGITILSMILLFTLLRKKKYLH